MASGEDQTNSDDKFSKDFGSFGFMDRAEQTREQIPSETGADLPVSFPLADRYQQLEAPIQGGMGVVFKALDKNLGINVAIKRILPEFASDRHFLQRFEREARTQVRLSHSHLVRIWDFVLDETGPYIVIDWIEGHSLDRELKQNGVLEEQRAAEIIAKVASALQVAHDAQIIHRDIKPANILLDQNGNPYIADFGLVRIEANESQSIPGTLSGALLGSVDFVAPEQLADARNASVRSDIWSLGATLYQLVTGRSVRGMRESLIPKSLREIILKAMEHEPEDRFSSMTEFAAALRSTVKPVEVTDHTPRSNHQDTPSPLTPTEDLASLLLKTQDEVTRQHAEARRLLDEYNYERAASILGQIPSHLRDMDLFKATIEKRDRVSDLDAVISKAVKEMHLDGLRQQVNELLDLQPQRDDLERLLEHLPKEPVRPKEPAQLVAPFDANVAKADQQEWSAHLGLDMETSNSIGMKFKLIPPGEFLMGSPESEANRDEAEVQHEVRITKPYYLGSTVVTQGQWKAVMGTTPWKGKDYVKEGDNYPATYVSWEDAQEFIQKLNASEGDLYRLPTEAEWEYACRAGSLSAYCFGDDTGHLSEYGWFDKNAWNINEKYAHQVGQKRSNPFGLYDTHGNVYEWCEDWYGGYASDAVTDPTGPTTGSSRVYRGGCWFFSSGHCRSAARDGYSPGPRNDDLGFRVLRSSVK
ncbi:bifunctional serine/threonine-protein kinase/formylglycine-generating enzyme family protein [Gimesia sp.]|uniref:bifunctional serine/threonine-protein kinase/formylglycine-generating enzyme family protein n=1 Tax=Gimesia sp. TaxID=2024833 RepID=UPI003A8E24BD